MNLIIIQAREKSTRLPKKVLLKLQDKTLLEHVYNRCKHSNADMVVIATTENSKKIQQLCIDKQMICFIGDEKDVLNRFTNCAEYYNADNIIRITCDNPCIDYKIINRVLKKHLKECNFFTTNAFLKAETFPDGLDVSVITRETLFFLYQNIHNIIHREHVVSYIMENPKYFKIGILKNKYKNIKHLRLTVDNKKDLELIKILYAHLYYKNKYFGLKEVFKFWRKYPKIFDINAEYKRDESYYKQKDKNV